MNVLIYNALIAAVSQMGLHQNECVLLCQTSQKITCTVHNIINVYLMLT